MLHESLVADLLQEEVVDELAYIAYPSEHPGQIRITGTLFGSSHWTAEERIHGK